MNKGTPGSAGTARIGFEIEFAGLSAPEAARVSAKAMGLVAKIGSPHHAWLPGTAIGDLIFELDTRYSKPAVDPGMVDWALESLELRETAANILSGIVPVELITPPVERENFDVVDLIVAALRDAGAEGTREHPLSAFGLHLNIELAPLDPARAIRIATAYACVEPWLRRDMGLDLSRRATPFIDPYPADFARQLAELFSIGEPPSMATFIRLYGIWNPNRNRGLDLWPLLAEFDGAAADAAAGAPVHGARPAFHYRLPDSRISEPGWSPTDDVARWDAIERIAESDRAFAAARGAFLGLLDWRISRAAYDTAIREAMA